MKILLVIPPSSTKVRWGKFKNAIQPYLPLGLAYIAAVIEKEGHEVKVIDAPAMRYYFKDIERMIREFSPDVVGQQTVFSNLDECYQVAKIAKAINPRIKVVLGGPHTTIYPDKSINVTEIDFIAPGEGELIIKGLLDSLENGADFSKVPGLIWKDGKTVIKNNSQPFIKDLDILPFPARNLFPMKMYPASSHLRGSKILSMVASRGCPFQCTFCWVSKSFGRTIRYRNPKQVVEEMRILKEQYGADSIRFWDDSFTASRKWVNDFCDVLIAENLNIPWCCLSRVDRVNQELLRKMKAAGCYCIFYGIESGVQRILDLLRKGITLEQARQAIKLARAVGIETSCSYMLALPTETREDSEQTINFAIELDSDYAQFNLVIPHISGEEFSNLAVKYGTLLEGTDHATFFDKPVYIPYGRTAEELKNTIKKSYKKYYLRPSRILRQLYKLRSLPLHKFLILIWTGLKVLFWR